MSPTGRESLVALSAVFSITAMGLTSLVMACALRMQSAVEINGLLTVAGSAVGALALALGHLLQDKTYLPPEEKKV